MQRGLSGVNISPGTFFSGVGAQGASRIRWPVGAAVDVCAASPQAELANEAR